MNDFELQLAYDEGYAKGYFEGVKEGFDRAASCALEAIEKTNNDIFGDKSE